jgi:predicted O-linked N-acetylglucosamine transferase (SPINDLY family)
VGYVSPDFHAHPVGYLIQAALEHRDRDRFEIYCYYSRNLADALTERFRSLADHWCDCFALNDQELAQQIRADGIDILVDLAGHTAYNRLAAFALRPAPVQLTWLGYFNTTGLASMDYLVSDRHSLSEAEAAQCAEQVVYLPELRFCYTPPAEALAAPQRRPAAPETVTFGCFNNTQKLNQPVIRAWSELLLRFPEGRLMLKWKTLELAEHREYLVGEFGACGVGPERLELRGFSSHAEMLAQYADVDVALDPFPFSGGMTSLEALWMGVPVVTLAGDRPAGRQSAAFLSTLGLGDLVATGVDAYIGIAERLARDAARRAALRETLRGLMAASPICDGKGFTAHLERVYQELWLNAGKAPDSGSPA